MLNDDSNDRPFIKLNEWWKEHQKSDYIRQTNANIDFYKQKHPQLEMTKSFVWLKLVF